MEVKSINQNMKYLLHSNHVTVICLFVANGKRLYAVSCRYWSIDASNADFLPSLYSRRYKYICEKHHTLANRSSAWGKDISFPTFFFASLLDSFSKGDLTFTSFWKNGFNSIVFAFEVIHLPVNLLLFSKFSSHFSVSVSN